MITVTKASVSNFGISVLIVASLTPSEAGITDDVNRRIDDRADKKKNEITGLSARRDWELTAAVFEDVLNPK